MDSLGYAEEEVSSSMSKMDEHLQGLPTALQDMTSVVQGIVVNTKDLNKSTEAGLALNDMLLAGGQSQQVVNAAQEQFRQILSKGKPEMQDWRSLTTAMPGQLDQLAKSMLGPTANANDLYAALGGGKNEQIISTDQLLDEIIRLDKEGGEGFASFEEQARKATGGIQTNMANVSTSITRGLANLMEEVGSDRITSVFNDIRGSINDAFGGAREILSDAMPLLEGGYELLKAAGPAAIAGGAGLLIFKGAVGAVNSVVGPGRARIDAYSASMASAGKSATGFGKLTAALGGPLGIATAAIGIGSAAVGFIADQYQKAQERQENFKASTVGLRQAVSNASALDSYKGRVDDIGESAGISAKSVDELAESGASMVESMNQRNSEAESSIGLLNEAEQIIKNSIGTTDLSTDAQGRLEWAIRQVNDQLGLNISSQDVLNGSYTDADGNVQNLTASLEELIATKKRDIELNVLSQDYEDAYKQQREAEKTYAAEYDKVDWDRVAQLESRKSSATDQFEIASLDTEILKLTGDVNSAKEQLDAARDSVAKIGEEMGQSAQAAEQTGDAYTDWANSMNGSFRDLANAHGGLDNLIEDMRNLGVNTDALTTMSEPALMALAKSYDGTALSLVQSLKSVDGALDANIMQVTRSSRKIASSLQEIQAEEALGNVGIKLTDFANAMNIAGLNAGDLANITTEQFAQMASDCNGDIDTMLAAIAEYNGKNLDGKEATVSINTQELRDANDQIYTFNDGKLLDKEGNIALAGTVVFDDANEKVLQWNGTDLKDLSAAVDVDYTSVTNADNALQSIFGYNGRRVNVTVNASVNKEEHAAGGIRLNAAGGIRYHAGGSIVNRPTPLDIVGEDGAEAIIPLTNKRYVEPFAETVADAIGTTPAGETKVFNIYLDGNFVSGGLSGATTLDEIARGLERMVS